MSHLTLEEWGALPAQDFRDALHEAPADIHPSLLRLRFRHNRKDFCRYCWPERFNLPFNSLHDDLFELGNISPWNEREKPDILDAIAAPRGFAKSTIVSFAMLAHAIAFDLEAYIVIMSSGQRLARSLSFDLRGLFMSKDMADNRRFSRLFGPFDVTGGKDEWQVSVRGRPSVGVLTASFGQDVRGAKHPDRGMRPTLVVLDDAEKKDRVRNPDQREIWQDILNKDILKLTDRQRGMAVRFVGTILHPDSILARREPDPGWNFRKYKAIITWPDKRGRDLWKQCQRIWANLRLPKRREVASDFYHQNRDDMDRGAVLLDPGGTTLFQLYEMIWSQGRSSFLQEMQNDPVDPSTQIYVSDNFVKFQVRTTVALGKHLVVDEGGGSTRTVRMADLRFKFMRWDPSLGNIGGDYAAVAVVARDRWGYKYVLACWMDRRPPSVQLMMTWALGEHWTCRKGSIEGNGFQELCAEPFMRQRAERRAAGQWWQLQLESDPSTSNKEERIASLEPEIANGWLAFNESLSSAVFRQFDHFPTADHDDAPDAIQGASAALGSAGEIGMRGGN